MASLNELKVTLYGGWDTAGRPWQMSWYYQISGLTVYPANLPQLLANELHDQFSAATVTLDNVLSTGVYATWMEVTSVYPPAYFPYGRVADFEGTAGSGDLLPESSGPLILLSPGFPTADYPRPGRLYWPGISEALQSSGAIEDAYVASLGSFWEDINELTFSAGGETANAQHVILSPTTEAKDPQDVEFILVSDKIARVVRRGRTFQGRSTTP